MSMRQLINSHDALPKYFQLVNILRHSIEDGEWAPYQAIPSRERAGKIPSCQQNHRSSGHRHTQLDRAIFIVNKAKALSSPPKSYRDP